MQEKKRVRLKANVTDECNREYRFSIEFFVFQQDGAYIAYCPSMDISTSGKTFNEAVGNFHEMFQLHIECCIDNESLIQDFLNHGWKAKNMDLLPPKTSYLMKKPEMKRLMDSNIGFEKIVTPARISVLS